MTKEQLKQIIREEILRVMEEEFGQGYGISTSPEEELEEKKASPTAAPATSTAPTQTPPSKKRIRPGYGKQFISKTEPKAGEKYSSAGTVNVIRNRKFGKKGSQQWKDRETVGKKMLNAMRRGAKKGKPDTAAATFRQGILKRMKKYGGPIPGQRGFKQKWTARDLEYSYVWAAATDYILKGGSASGFTIQKYFEFLHNLAKKVNKKNVSASTQPE